MNNLQVPSFLITYTDKISKVSLCKMESRASLHKMQYFKRVWLFYFSSRLKCVFFTPLIWLVTSCPQAPLRTWFALSERKRQQRQIITSASRSTRKKGQNLNWRPGFQMSNLLIFSRDCKWVVSFLLTAIAFLYSQQWIQVEYIQKKPPKVIFKSTVLVTVLLEPVPSAPLKWELSGSTSAPSRQLCSAAMKTLHRIEQSSRNICSWKKHPAQLIKMLQ